VKKVIGNRENKVYFCTSKLLFSKFFRITKETNEIKHINVIHGNIQVLNTKIIAQLRQKLWNVTISHFLFRGIVLDAK